MITARALVGATGREVSSETARHVDDSASAELLAEGLRACDLNDTELAAARAALGSSGPPPWLRPVPAVSVLEAARSYARRGWPVLPLKPREKVPATAHGLRDATCAAAQIERWFPPTSRRNVGIRTGAESGLLVLDLDGPRELLRGRQIPTTPTQKTGRGCQFLFKFPPAVTFSTNRAGIDAGLDVRGNGGYIVAPPSVHPTGAVYQWLPGRSPDDVALAQPPDWLLELLAPQQRAQGNLGYFAAPPPRHPRPLPAVAVAGTRNDTLARLVGALLRTLDPGVAVDLARAWSQSHCTPPMDRREVERTIASILRRELAGGARGRR